MSLLISFSSISVSISNLFSLWNSSHLSSFFFYPSGWSLIFLAMFSVMSLFICLSPSCYASPQLRRHLSLTHLYFSISIPHKKEINNSPNPQMYINQRIWFDFSKVSSKNGGVNHSIHHCDISLSDKFVCFICNYYFFNPSALFLSIFLLVSISSSSLL